MALVIEQVRRMRGGAQSQLMHCEDDGYYIVKFQNNPQGTRILVNELLGARLGARLGLPLPAAAGSGRPSRAPSLAPSNSFTRILVP